MAQFAENLNRNYSSSFSTFFFGFFSFFFGLISLISYYVGLIRHIAPFDGRKKIVCVSVF